MKDINDIATVDFLAGKVAGRGGRKKIYADTAARVAAYRKRLGKKSLTVLIEPELLKRLDEFMLARDETKAQVVERALQYFFRKR